MLAQFKGYLIGGALVLVILLSAISVTLYKKVNVLELQNKDLALIAKEKQKAAQECSDSVKFFREAETEKTKLAQKALEEAKKEADEWREKAKNTSQKKPKEVIVTDKNNVHFGGNDSTIQLKDYLATHQLMNEDIDERDEK